MGAVAAVRSGAVLAKVIASDAQWLGTACYVWLASVWLCFTFVHAGFSSSLCLLASGFFFAHHIGIIAMRLAIAILMSCQSPDPSYSFGYQRLGVVGEYAIGSMLVFAGFTVLLEGTHRLFHTDPVACTWHTIALAVGQMVLICIGKYGLALGADERTGKWEQAIAQTLNDNTSSLVCMLSCFVIDWTGYNRVDIATAYLNALLSIRHAWPRLKLNGSVLLQQAPKLGSALQQALKQAAAENGVLEVKLVHHWALRPGQVVICLRVRISQEANECAVVRSLHQLLRPYLTHLTVQVEKEDWDLEGSGSNWGKQNTVHSPATHETTGRSHSHEEHGHAHSHAHGCSGHSHASPTSPPLAYSPASPAEFGIRAVSTPAHSDCGSHSHSHSPGHTAPSYAVPSYPDHADNSSHRVSPGRTDDSGHSHGHSHGHGASGSCTGHSHGHKAEPQAPSPMAAANILVEPSAHSHGHGHGHSHGHGQACTGHGHGR
eukprot:TRINITY_DN93322_c0_g1_i1.p1 TRINITY_DN93322_c0_g1~~TRINITY_DN93322_c0_g1_i1.p1  ORF type:complete len:507 (+),score=46.81 TRINITY_DN93322_c0_g1_i1:60-1523(+)